MAIFKDQQERTYTIDTENVIASGGEGTICSIRGMQDKVAKLFYTNTAKNKMDKLEEKIVYMAYYYNHLSLQIQKDVIRQITWPEVALYDFTGNFRGYIMQRVAEHETLDCAYLESQKTKSDFTFEEKVGIAKNLCIAVNIMHSKLKTVVGDFNSKNIMVSIKKGTVYLVDADSFHIRYMREIRGRRAYVYYPTEVGRPEYLPKELHDYVIAQKVDLNMLPQPSFNHESDLFGLAIHIFQLLMNGTHPYGLRINPAEKTESISVSKTDISWAENIKKGRYVYSNAPALLKVIKGFSPPKFAPDYNVIPNYLQDMFERAFVASPHDELMLNRRSNDGKYISETSVRPSAAEWYLALDYFSKDLKVCNVNPRHQYGRHLGKCPWCKV